MYIYTHTYVYMYVLLAKNNTWKIENLRKLQRESFNSCPIALISVYTLQVFTIILIFVHLQDSKNIFTYRMFLKEVVFELGYNPDSVN